MSTATIDNIDTYVRDINRYSLIGRDEERRLAQLARSADPETAKAAKDQLICANLRLVVKIAHTFKQYELPLSDLVAEGNLGLLHAADKFDPDNGAKFSVYASWWIKQAMRVAVAERTRTVRIPRNSGIKLMKLSRARASWISEYAREPTVEELSYNTGIPEAVVARLLHTPDRTVSMNAHTDDSDDSSPTYDAMLSDELTDEQPGKQARSALIYAALGKLSDLDRELVNGVYWEHDKTDLPGLALRVGLSVDAASRRLTKALAALKELLADAADADGAFAPA